MVLEPLLEAVSTEERSVDGKYRRDIEDHNPESVTRSLRALYLLYCLFTQVGGMCDY